jgi:hypothetical protein
MVSSYVVIRKNSGKLETILLIIFSDLIYSRVFISDVTKHSPAAVCGLRDGDRILEINGTTIETLTYETILDKIKQHMAADDLELLVLDKKSVHWYRERNYPITSRTLPTIVHMEPILNDGTTEIQSSEVPATQTKLVGFPGIFI